MSQGGQSGGNVYTNAAGALTGAGNATQGAINTFQNTPTIASGMSAYQNPFTQDVIDRSMSDVGRMTAMQQEANKAQAAQMGAFGGSRQGLVEAETNAAAQRTIGDLSANLRSQGFNTAAGLAGQDIGNRMTGAQGMLSGAGTLGNLGTAGFNMGNTLQQQQAQQGLLQQQMQQQMLTDAQNQFYGFANSPNQYLNLMQQASAGSPLNNNVTSESGYNPGLFGLIGGAAQIGSLF
jgi:hypothetical protein